MLKFNSFKAKEQFWNDIFSAINIYMTGEKYYLTHDQELAFFLLIWAYTYSYWFFTYKGYVVSRFYWLFWRNKIVDYDCFNFS